MVEFLRSEELNGEGETVTAFWTGYCGVLFGCKNIPETICCVFNLQKRGFSCKISKINLISSITKMQKETQHGKYNLCRNGCPQG